MELKDVILSTLAEMEEVGKVQETTLPMQSPVIMTKEGIAIDIDHETTSLHPHDDAPYEHVPFEAEPNVDNERVFLTSIRERLLVLFEGFQAPNNTNIEAKVDMTLNFLEYVLVTTDARIQEIDKKTKR